jgi:beta-lactamase superfamily II metal-dependent hydrolase
VYFLRLAFLFVFIFFCKVSFAQDYLVVRVFDVGQGNCVALRYKDQSILFDCGSKELQYPAIYDYKTTKDLDDDEDVVFQVFKQPTALLDHDQATSVNSLLDALSALDISSTRQRSDQAFQAHSSESSSGDETDLLPKNKKKVLSEYKKGMLDDIREFLGENVKTIMVSHPDEDHYNLISTVFEKGISRGTTIVLGGFYEDYNESFREWVVKQKKNRVIFTGVADGERGRKEMGRFPRGFARSYCSKALNKTPIEEEIENALAFRPEAGTALPIVEILSMNAGHGLEANGIVRRISEGDNDSSIILRVSYSDQSIILPGDASGVTWDHVWSNYWIEGEMESDYFLLSHHRSATHGSTRLKDLRKINPKACFISAGRHKGYHHPQQEPFLSVIGLEGLYSTDNHHVSYFTAEPHKYNRNHTQKAVFSTLNNGTMTISLGRPDIFSVIASRTKEETLQYGTETKALNFFVNYGQVFSEKSFARSDAPHFTGTLKLYLESERKNARFFKRISESSSQIALAEEEIKHNDDSQEYMNFLSDKGKIYVLEEERE